MIKAKWDSRNNFLICCWYHRVPSCEEQDVYYIATIQTNIIGSLYLGIGWVAMVWNVSPNEFW